MTNKTVAKLEKSNFLHKFLIRLTQFFRFNLLDEDYRWNRYSTVHVFIGMYALVAYFYNLKKFWSDFDFVMFSSIMTAPIISVIYRIFNW